MNKGGLRRCRCGHGPVSHWGPKGAQCAACACPRYHRTWLAGLLLRWL